MFCLFFAFQVREVCEVIASGIQPLQNLIVLIHVGEEKKNEWAQHWINRGFKAVEKLLSQSAGKYCVGDEITFADCCLIPQVPELGFSPFPPLISNCFRFLTREDFTWT